MMNGGQCTPDMVRSGKGVQMSTYHAVLVRCCSLVKAVTCIQVCCGQRLFCLGSHRMNVSHACVWLTSLQNTLKQTPWHI